MNIEQVEIDTKKKSKNINLIEKDTDSYLEENLGEENEQKVNITEAKDNRYLDYVVGSSNIKFSSQEILHFLAQLIEYEHKSDGYRYIYRNTYKLYLYLENMLSVLIQIITAATTLLSALLIIVKCNSSIFEQWIIPITVLVLAFGSAVISFLKDKLGYQKALEENKELENYFNRFNADVGEIADKYFIFYKDDNETVITINFRKNADIESVMEQIKKDYKKFANNYTNISGKILSRYKKKYKGRKILVDIAEYNKNYLSNEIILIHLGYDLSKKDILPKIKIIDTSCPVIEDLTKTTNPLIRRIASRFKQTIDNETNDTNEIKNDKKDNDSNEDSDEDTNDK